MHINQCSYFHWTFPETSELESVHFVEMIPSKQVRGKRRVGRQRRRWVDNIKMNLREIGSGGIDCIDLGQNRDQWSVLVNTVMNLRVP
jgi:hypothetical protein